MGRGWGWGWGLELLPPALRRPGLASRQGRHALQRLRLRRLRQPAPIPRPRVRPPNTHPHAPLPQRGGALPAEP